MELEQMTIEELQALCEEKRKVYETALIAVARTGSNKVDIQNAADILDQTYSEYQTVAQELENRK